MSEDLEERIAELERWVQDLAESHDALVALTSSIIRSTFTAKKSDLPVEQLIEYLLYEYYQAHRKGTPGVADEVNAWRDWIIKELN